MTPQRRQIRIAYTSRWKPGKLKAFRKHLGVTQKGLAARLGGGDVCNWENLGAQPSAIYEQRLDELAAESGFEG